MPVQPIFSTRFLLPPFPPNLAVSGGVYGQNEATELVLWDLSCRQEHVGRLGWRLGDNGGMDNLAGAFDVKQIPGTQQVGVWGGGEQVPSRVSVGVLGCNVAGREGRLVSMAVPVAMT